MDFCKEFDTVVFLMIAYYINCNKYKEKFVILQAIGII